MLKVARDCDHKRPPRFFHDHLADNNLAHSLESKKSGAVVRLLARPRS